tara:strand:- start:1179 stop:1409 length:231 start_codon:yes stop_codon:yes gene_type:complete
MFAEGGGISKTPSRGENTNNQQSREWQPAPDGGPRSFTVRMSHSAASAEHLLCDIDGEEGADDKQVSVTLSECFKV